MRGALDYLNQALNKLGVLAFDQPDMPDSDESVARSVALSLDHLSGEERERYAQLAFFPPDEIITSAKLAVRWRLDEFEAEKLLQRFAELALIKYDLRTKIVQLGSALRDYLLSPASGYDLNSRYDSAFEHLSAEEQAVARRVMTRLVRLALPNERAGARTSLYCLEWTVDPVAGTVDQHSGVVGQIARVDRAVSPEEARLDTLLDTAMRTQCVWS